MCLYGAIRFRPLLVVAIGDVWSCPMDLGLCVGRLPYPFVFRIWRNSEKTANTQGSWGLGDCNWFYPRRLVFICQIFSNLSFDKISIFGLWVASLVAALISGFWTCDQIIVIVSPYYLIKTDKVVSVLVSIERVNVRTHR